jgi:DNA-binding MarR family transcriptional regulator
MLNKLATNMKDKNVADTRSDAADILKHVHSRPGHLIRRAQQVAVAIFSEECGAYDLTPVQYAALVAIRAYPDVDATRLSALIAFDRSTLGNVLERLEGKGLVSRRGTRDDKRIKLVRITAKGERLLKDVEPRVARAQARLLAPLAPQERKTLLSLLDRLTTQNTDDSRALPRVVTEPARS